MTSPPGLPDAPALGAHALPLDTYAGDVVVITGGGTGLGKAIATLTLSSVSERETGVMFEFGETEERTG